MIESNELNKIKEKMKERKITQSELARELKISRQMVSQIFKNQASSKRLEERIRKMFL